MADVTLSDLRTRARRRADIEKSLFVSDSELNQYINDSYLELYDLLVTKFEDYYAKDPYSFTIASGESSIDLPSDFYKSLGVDRKISGTDYYPLDQFNFRNRNFKRLPSRRMGLYPSIQYRIYGDKLIFMPEDLCPGDYRWWYVPKATTMSSDTDTIDGVNGWEEYVVIDAAIKCLVKEESDISALQLAKNEIKRRIDEAALNRDAGETSEIQDVRTDYWDDPLFFY